MADDCEGFEPNKWRQNVCAKCFKLKSLHGTAGLERKEPPGRPNREPRPAGNDFSPSLKKKTAPLPEPPRKPVPAIPQPQLPQPQPPQPATPSPTRTGPNYEALSKSGGKTPSPKPPARPKKSKTDRLTQIDRISFEGTYNEDSPIGVVNLAAPPRKRSQTAAVREKQPPAPAPAPTPAPAPAPAASSSMVEKDFHKVTVGLTVGGEKMKTEVGKVFGGISSRAKKMGGSSVVGERGKGPATPVRIEKCRRPTEIDCSKWSTRLETWNIIEGNLSQGATSCLKIQDDILEIMVQTEFLSPKSSKNVWELVTSDGQKKSAAKGQQFSKGEFDCFNKKALDHLRSIVTIGQYLLEAQQTQRSIIIVQARIRGYLARKEFAKSKSLYLSGPLLQRNIYFRELLKKEESYNFSLDVIVSQFLHPARELAKSHFRKGMPSSEVSAIFGNIEEVQKVHGNLHYQLKRVEEEWPNISGVGTAFLRCMDSFKCYGKYVNNFQFAIDSLTNCLEKYEPFSQMCLESFEKTDFELQSLISAPLNQMSMYELMLERVLENTPPKLLHDEAKALEQCISAIKETNIFILNELENAENQAKILNVERRINRKQKLLQKGRVYVAEWGVDFFDRAIPSKRYNGDMVLFSDHVLLAKNMNKKGMGLKGFYSLETATVISPEDLKKQNGFELCVNDGGLRYAVIFQNAMEMPTGLKDMKEHISKNQKNRVFEVSLTQVLANEGNPDPPIPSVVRSLISYLDEKALKTEGLFRVAGSRKDTDEMRSQIDKGVVIDWQTVNGIHSIASLLKLYFRCLPEPLLTFAVYEPLIKAQETFSVDGNASGFREKIRKLVDKIPYENRILTKYLIDFLARVAENSAVNMMLPSNLAICFAPNLLRPQEQSISAALDVMKVNGIVETLIVDSTLISQKR